MGRKKYTIEDLKKYAEKKNGKCLSNIYGNCDSKYKWMCSNGHVWLTSWSHIYNKGSWCPKCSHVGRYKKYTIKDMRKIAKERNGECLSDKYDGMNKKLEWKCNICEYIWEAIPANIIYFNTWCPECAKDKNREAQKKYTIKDMLKIAKEKGGECLSDSYINIYTKLKWKCNFCNNVWTSIPQNIIHGDSWCPECSKRLRKKYIIEDMQKIAFERNGECLSSEYEGMENKLKWKCNVCENIWETAPSTIIYSNSWCPECAKKITSDKNRKYTTDDLREHAKLKNGVCLSKKYLGYRNKHVWKCSQGHIWESTPHSVLSKNSWCPECAKTIVAAYNRLTIGDMQKEAKERSGECLSKKYFNMHTKLKWKCNICSCIWEATPSHIIHSNSWCPYCKNKSESKFREVIEEMVISR